MKKGTRYMFWSCTKLVDFWSEIFNTICVACSLDIDAHPLSALFGVTRGEKQCLKWDTMAFCNLIARRLILLCILLTTGGFFPPFSLFISNTHIKIRVTKIKITTQNDKNLNKNK